MPSRTVLVLIGSAVPNKDRDKLQKELRITAVSYEFVYDLPGLTKALSRPHSFVMIVSNGNESDLLQAAAKSQAQSCKVLWAYRDADPRKSFKSLSDHVETCNLRDFFDNSTRIVRNYI